LKKLEKLKDLQQQIKAAKDDKIKLEEEIRKCIREKGEDKEQYLQLTEEKIKLLAEKNDLQNKISSLLKDNQTLENNLKEL
jgi:predicted  nucleic acid-binding Zn-ribbon protein